MRRPATLCAMTTAALLLATATGRAAAADAQPRALTLEEARQLIEKQSPTLAQARARGEEAHALLRQATSAFLPTLVASGSYVRNSDQAGVTLPTALGGKSLIIQPLESFSGSIAMRVPLFSGSAIWEAMAARESTKSADEQVESARQQLLAGVEQSAWWAQASEESARAAENAVTVAQSHLDNAQRAVKAGVSIPLTQLQAQTELLRRKSEFARARADRDKAQLALGVLLGIDGPVLVTMPELGVDADIDVDARIAAGLERRPELKGLLATRRAADLMVDAAWLRLTPLVWATGSATTSNVPFPTGEKNAWRASLELQWTLYDGGFRYGREHQAEAQRAQADAGIRAQRLAIAQEVRNAARDLAVARERLELAEQQAQVAGNLAAMARRGFESGVAPSLDVIDANNTEYQAQVGLAAARAEVGSARAALARASGEVR